MKLDGPVHVTYYEILCVMQEVKKSRELQDQLDEYKKEASVSEN